MSYKVITKGRLDFGTPKTFDLLVEMYTTRTEQYYKNIVLFKAEEIFNAEAVNVAFNKLIVPVTSRKSIKNTIDLIRLLAGYGTSGEVKMWIMREGELKEFHSFEPVSDRSYILAYKEGCKQLDAKNFEKAAQYFTKAIKKNDEYADAYEKLGTVNQKMGNTKDALTHFKKAAAIHPENIYAQFGAASIYLENEDLENGMVYLNNTIKYSIPHEWQYWTARYFKGCTLVKLGNTSKAEQEFKFFTRKVFDESNPNYQYRRKALYTFGKMLLDKGDTQGASEQFKIARKVANNGDEKMALEIAAYEGYAKFLLGLNGYRTSWQKAAKAGMPEAKKWLQGIDTRTTA